MIRKKRNLVALAVGGACVVALIVWLVRPSNARYGLTDRQALADVQHDFASEASRAPPGPAMKFDSSRLVGVGHEPGARESGEYATHLWFVQDNHSVLDAAIYEDCDIKLYGGASRDDMKNAAYTPSPPKL
jgi:hypothetical protein